MSSAEERGKRGLTTLELAGFAIGSSGGPLALAAIYLVQGLKGTGSLGGIITLGGVLLFLAPLAIWREYSRTISTSGGLYTFVRHAAGSKTALAHGVLWSISYLLYLPFTVAYIVYFLLPEMLPVSAAAQAMLEIALPLLLSVAVVAADRASIAAVAGFGAVQLAAMVVLVLLLFGRPLPPQPVAAHPVSIASGLGGGSLLFVCSSLVLYLGGEARGGGRGMRRALLATYLAAGAAYLLAAFAIAPRVTPQVANSAVPGYALALELVGPGLALVVGLASLASVGALVAAEYLALVRLWKEMFHWHPRRSGLLIALFFVVADAVSLTNPFKFYDIAIVPSLAALFLSQLIVFAAYPFLKREGRRLSVAAVIAVVIAAVWAIYGIYQAVAPSPSY